jgi:DNA-directed RNA polymerase subunit M/transcription elongation factor TFIIS
MGRKLNLKKTTPIIKPLQKKEQRLCIKKYIIEHIKNKNINQIQLKPLVDVIKIKKTSSKELYTSLCKYTNDATRIIKIKENKEEEEDIVEEYTCDIFTCGKCHQQKTKYYEKQTRSADGICLFIIFIYINIYIEPMTLFITCICGWHWRQ